METPGATREGGGACTVRASTSTGAPTTRRGMRTGSQLAARAQAGAGLTAGDRAARATDLSAE